MDSRFSPETTRILMDAGWYFGRVENIEKQIDILVSSGYTVPRLVHELFSEFLSLRVNHPHSRVKNAVDYFTIGVTPDQAINTFSEVQMHARKTNSQLCIIGQTHRGHMSLLSDAKGNIYSSYGDILYYIDDNPDGAIERLCTGKEIRLFPTFSEGRTGTGGYGLCYIRKKHGDDFIKCGVGIGDIQECIQEIVLKGKRNEYRERGWSRAVFDSTINGNNTSLSVLMAPSGYVISANLLSQPLGKASANIKLMADYETFSLWNSTDRTVGSISPETIPLTSSTIKRLGNWSQIYDSWINISHPELTEYPSEHDIAFFKEEAQRLVEILREEAGKKYTISCDFSAL